MKITFVGGWATSAQQYPRLAASARFLIPFTGVAPTQLCGVIAEGGDVLVGWSTGAHMLLKDCRNLFSGYDRVVLIAPFLSFTDSFPKRLIRGMIAGMENDPAAVVRSFHENCGETDIPDYNPDQTVQLVAGLDFLNSSRIEIDGKFSCPNLTLVHAAEDRIVRRKAFDKVAGIVQNSVIMDIAGGHKISETKLMSIIKG
jgi:hypothetical protein